MDMTKLKIFRWGDYSKYLGGPEVVTRLLRRGRQKGES